MLIIENKVCLDDIKEAYKKLKTYVYNDNFNLHLRIKLAEFESDNDDIEKTFQTLLENINNKNISDYVSEIKSYILPKTIKEKENRNNIIRNDSCDLSDNIEIDSYNNYIDAPIEIYILDILWIIKEGLYLINDKINNNCYGNTLVIDKNNGCVKHGHYLFNRYFDKYQTWRDNGIKAAREQSNNNNEVLLICFDIKKFYPSSEIDFNKIRNTLHNKNISNKFTDLIEQVYIAYQNIIKPGVKSPQLPIGLLSSGVIANWYLSDFDVALKERFNPIYYGRYVDDIFMVLSNVKPSTNNKNWFDEKFLYGNDTPLLKIKNEDNEDTYAIKNHTNLILNPHKIKIFYFSPQYPSAILDNFQKQLDENNSAFWFLPEDNDLDDTINSQSFDLIYNDTINNFREITGVKNNKYGLSVFLTKQIKKEIICNGNSTNIKRELFRYFKGCRAIEMYTLWEKVLTYFVVQNDIASISKFEKTIHKEIERISSKDINTIEVIKKPLSDYYKYSENMAMALNYNTITTNKNTDKLHIKIRNAYLIRQHYLPLPISIYTNLIDENNIISNEIFSKFKNLSTNPDINSYKNPRMIHSHEICILKFLEYIGKIGNNKEKPNYVNDLIKTLNDFNLNENNITYEPRSIIYNNNDSNKTLVEIQKIYCNDCTIEKKQQIKVALSNIKINNKDFISNIKNISNIDTAKIQRHFHLINLAIKESVDCLVLPEISVPKELLTLYAEQSRHKQQLMILGLEHIVSKECCYNFSIVFLPYIHNGYKEVLMIPRLKNHYSPQEKKEILKYKKSIPEIEPYLYQLFIWKDIRFTVFNCFELADIFHRSLFKSNIDIMFAIENNKDTYYYNNIVESTCRDLHCYFIQVNTSEWGDSRLSIPKKSEKMTPVRIKGGDNDIIITFNLDIKVLRDFHEQDQLYQNTEEFKNTPPGSNSIIF